MGFAVSDQKAPEIQMSSGWIRPNSRSLLPNIFSILAVIAHIIITKTIMLITKTVAYSKDCLTYIYLYICLLVLPYLLHVLFCFYCLLFYLLNKCTSIFIFVLSFIARC